MTNMAPGLETGTTNPEKGTDHPSPALYAMDYGVGSSSAVHGPDGPQNRLRFPPVAGGLTGREEFLRALSYWLQHGDVLLESATIGSYGSETSDMLRLLTLTPHRVFVIPGRAVKNYRLDHDMKKKTATVAEAKASHRVDAKILYGIGTAHPERLRLWTPTEKYKRKWRSVRPLDQRGYMDPEVDALMALLPRFEDLPGDLARTLMVKRGDGIGYRMSLAVPFARALLELERNPPVTPSDPRGKFEKILGNYEHGYPSYYRRMTVQWMQLIATGDVFEDERDRKQILKEDRKRAQRVARKQIRHLFHLCRALRAGTMDPVTGNVHPLSAVHGPDGHAGSRNGHSPSLWTVNNV